VLAAPTSEALLDKWLISELHQLIKEVNDEMENYRLMQATRKFAPFVDNLSNWYIRRSRKRFWKSENDEDKNGAYATLHYVLVELSKTIAPFAPFLAEEIYTNLVHGSRFTVHGSEQQREDVVAPSARSTASLAQDDEDEQTNTTRRQPIQRGASRYNEAPADTTTSVHLQDFPVANENLIDEDLNKQMQFVRDIISEGLKLRARTQIKVRQPLAKLVILPTQTNADWAQTNAEFVEIVKEELNVKDVMFTEFDFNEKAKNMSEINGVKIKLETEITPELKMEGQAREIIRAIQQMRKEADYQLDDRIRVGYQGFDKVFTKFSDFISHETLADKLTAGKLENSDLEKEVKIDDETVVLTVGK